MYRDFIEKRQQCLIENVLLKQAVVSDLKYRKSLIKQSRKEVSRMVKENEAVCDKIKRGAFEQGILCGVLSSTQEISDFFSRAININEIFIAKFTQEVSDIMSQLCYDAGLIDAYISEWIDKQRSSNFSITIAVPSGLSPHFLNADKDITQGRNIKITTANSDNVILTCGDQVLSISTTNYAEKFVKDFFLDNAEIEKISLDLIEKLKKRSGLFKEENAN